mmetsp:Transcript_10321/g.26713  ORF Transcript_10321/g.26713 Transcript_10321/m.26713 type:complete len:936 (+) Transcript_10321:91-2898(+)|eukprot:CAMPEP_0183387224 /NCGR_PEP_ID=MMETSP0370-20130417/3008_1 /TAXON_ID=268820 /ORGANISM="Peridinium aciculiferum, Strain PAER-2" /LENGTH=935 /DNA_ID=CAMNT_0025565753 /DNA_START=37 /DNA_END=2844 /DNA_ORIENTATION=-
MQQLPAKDQAVFRSIVKFYETKQYKKGVKAADSILKKHPDHGETLCMKGLTLSYLDKKEEAYELVRKGLRHDIRSHVCWHVFGLLYRQDRDYVEAIKCYAQALKIDPENLQILRDISLLQIHRRDFTGYAETRRKLLQTKPSNRLNWIGYAISEHLCRQYEFAWTCLDNYEKTFKDEDLLPYDKSELILYKAQIMEEGGKFEESLECLKQHEKTTVDKLNLQEAKGRLCMFLERHSEAAEIYRRLLDKNPEHHTYVLAYMANQPQFHRFWPALPKPAVVQPREQLNGEKLEEAAVPATISSFPQTVHPQGMPIWGWLHPSHAPRTSKRVSVGRRLHKQRCEMYQPLVALTEEEEEAVCKFFDDLQADHPKSDSLKQLVLNFISGDRFKSRLDAYMRPQMRKGVPSLFRAMKPLYFQEGKPKLVEELLLQYNKYLNEEVSWFGPEIGKSVEPGFVPDEEEPPSSLLFTRMVTADHYDFLGETSKALEFANSAIEHTPTLVEIYACKARIYRHAGNLEESAKWYEEVRSMDLADRYLNTQCVRALLRLDDTQGGMEKALLFSKEPDSVEAANLHDMQCMWYESHVGRSYVRQKKYGRALKKFGETFKHFGDIAEDQFDFHNYCLRKTTLKAYVGMLRMQEKLYSHKFFRRAAKDAIKIYIELFDMKARGEAITKGDAAGEGNEDDLSAADKKKLKHKLKREADKKKEKVDPKAAATTTGKPKKVDEDPEGEKLLEKDPMEEANKLLKTLVLYCTSDIATHCQTYEVASRQGKLLHCLQAVLKLFELSGKNNLHYKLVAPLAHFCFVADLECTDMNPAVREVILSEIAPVFGETSAFGSVAALRTAASKVVDQVEQRLKSTPEMPVIEAMYSMKCLKHAGKNVKDLLEKEWQPTGSFSLKECEKMLSYLSAEFGKDSAALDRFKKRCQDIFPLLVVKS